MDPRDPFSDSEDSQDSETEPEEQINSNAAQILRDQLDQSTVAIQTPSYSDFLNKLLQNTQEKSTQKPANSSVSSPSHLKAPEKSPIDYKFPQARIRAIIRSDPQVKKLSSDSELFLQGLSKSSYRFTLADNRKMLTQQDIQAAIRTVPAFEFLRNTFDMQETDSMFDDSEESSSSDKSIKGKRRGALESLNQRKPLSNVMPIDQFFAQMNEKSNSEFENDSD